MYQIVRVFIFAAAFFAIGALPATAQDVCVPACTKDFDAARAKCAGNPVCERAARAALSGCNDGCVGKSNVPSTITADDKKVWCRPLCDKLLPGNTTDRALCYDSTCDGKPVVAKPSKVPDLVCQDCVGQDNACKQKCADAFTANVNREIGGQLLPGGQKRGMAYERWTPDRNKCEAACGPQLASCVQTATANGCKAADAGKTIKSAETLKNEAEAKNYSDLAKKWTADFEKSYGDNFRELVSAYTNGYNASLQRKSALDAAGKAAAELAAKKAAEEDAAKKAAETAAAKKADADANAAAMFLAVPLKQNMSADSCRRWGFTQFTNQRNSQNCDCPSPTVWRAVPVGTSACACPAGFGRDGNGICRACAADEQSGESPSRTDFICVKKPTPEGAQYKARLDAVKARRRDFLANFEKAAAPRLAEINAAMAAVNAATTLALDAFKANTGGVWKDGVGVDLKHCDQAGIADKGKCVALGEGFRKMFNDIQACRAKTADAVKAIAQMTGWVEATRSRTAQMIEAADGTWAKYVPGVAGWFGEEVSGNEGMIAVDEASANRILALLAAGQPGPALVAATKAACDPLTADAAYVTANKSAAQLGGATK